MDHRGCRLRRELVAELPQFLRRPRLLEENLIDFEGVKGAGTVATDSLPNAGDELFQLRLVVLRDHGARCLSLRLAGHEYEATQTQPRSGTPASRALGGMGDGMKSLACMAMQGPSGRGLNREPRPCLSLERPSPQPRR